MESLNVRIEKLVYGGEGLAHHNAQTVFVPLVLPGEEVAVEPVERRTKFVRARVTGVLTPSPERVVPPCPHFGVCGGCHYQHIPYPAQVRHKTEILRETLARIGGIRWDAPIVPHESLPFGYRNRAQWAVRSEEGRSAAGYFQAGTSSVCSVTECGVLSPRLAGTLAAVQALLASGTLPGVVREIEVAADSADACVAMNVSFESFAQPPKQLGSLLRAAVPAIESLLLLDRRRERFELMGPGYLHHDIGDFRYRVGHLSFFQVNRFLTAELISTVLGSASGALALDLFAGVGVFTIPLAKRFERVIAVDANVAAVRDLRANIEAAGSSATALHSPAEPYLRGMKDRPNLVVLDPPRAGLSAGATQKLVRIVPEEIAYLSCDPATLARDLAALTGIQKPKQGAAEPVRGGPYEIAEIHLFDLFPQTYHIETFVRLRRST